MVSVDVKHHVYLWIVCRLSPRRGKETHKKQASGSVATCLSSLQSEPLTITPILFCLSTHSPSPLHISPPHSPKNPTYPTMSKLQIDLIFNSCPVNHNVSYQGESKLLVKSKMSRDPPKRKCSVQVSSCCHASSTVSAVKWTRFPKKKEDTARNHFSTIKQLNKHL